jgi:hypothetical protein
VAVECELHERLFDVHLEAGKPRLAPHQYARGVPLPSSLAPRLAPEHARGVTTVFEEPDGWLVMLDHGEFGGGIEWYAKAGGPPRPVVVPGHREPDITQNVSHAVAHEGIIFMLQGLFHATLSRGYLSALWRERGELRARIVVRFESRPRDWLPRPDGTWLVLTDHAIWKTSLTGTLKLVTRVPDVLPYLLTFVQTADGTFHLAGQGGALGLTPTWAEEPRHRADLLLPAGSEQAQCWARWSVANSRSRANRK